MFEIVPAAVEHPVEIERSAAGQQRHRDIKQDRQHGDEEEQLLPGDREAGRRHLPVQNRNGASDGFERFAERGQKFRDMFIQKRIDRAFPVFLQQKTAGSADAAEHHRGPRPGGGAAFPVESADDRRTGAAEVDRPGDRKEHQDVGDLPEIEAEHPREGRHREDRNPQQRQMRSGRKRLAAEGQDHVLYENAAPAVQIGGVGAEHQEQRQRAEHPGHADREDAAQRHRHGHLIPDGFGGLRGVEPDLRQLGIDRRRLRSEIGVVHIDVGAEHQQQQRNGLEAVAPDAEHAAHLLLVGLGSAGVVPLIALPRHAAVDGVEDSDQHVEDVEVGHHAGVEGV